MTDLKLSDSQLLRAILAAQRDMAAILAQMNMTPQSRESANTLYSNLNQLLQGIPK